MGILLRKVVKLRRQFLIERLVQLGVYKRNNKHLYEWTLSDLEDAYKYTYVDQMKEEQCETN
ncbi:Fur-regulated basic protein FbpA [Bacillus sp. FJAT-29814]|uniref:Fur-regulated basic protein FbpA n=1 Tax=Bacillus sp. FJAT-29814 TaxID=1729688 RepID=UPI000836B107|nr:Fur-regulated basic protein FbpA [Bacillus sp. FJAT-29814]